MHTAIPDADRATTSYFLRYGLTSRSVNLGTLKRAVRDRAATPGISAVQPLRPPATPRRGLKAQVKRAARTTLVSVYNQVQHVFDGAGQWPDALVEPPPEPCPCAVQMQEQLHKFFETTRCRL